MTDVLKIELDFFEQHRQEWYEHHAGKIVVIHGTTVYGFYDNYENALQVGYDQCGLVPFLLKEVSLEDRVDFSNVSLRDHISDRGEMMTDWDKELQGAAERALETATAVIRKNGPKSKPYCVYSEKGRKFGCYPTREQAEERLAQMEKFKHMKKE